jgi:hypothetical protein
VTRGEWQSQKFVVGNQGRKKLCGSEMMARGEIRSEIIFIGQAGSGQPCSLLAEVICKDLAAAPSVEAMAHEGYAYLRAVPVQQRPGLLRSRNLADSSNEKFSTSTLKRPEPSVGTPRSGTGLFNNPGRRQVPKADGIGPSGKKLLHDEEIRAGTDVVGTRRNFQRQRRRPLWNGDFARTVCIGILQ